MYLRKSDDDCGNSLGPKLYYAHVAGPHNIQEPFMSHTSTNWVASRDQNAIISGTSSCSILVSLVLAFCVRVLAPDAVIRFGNSISQ